MDDRWEKKLDEVFTMARGAVWDTEALAHGFETRLMARIASEQEERARSLVWIWRLVPVFCMIVLFLGLYGIFALPSAPDDLGAAIGSRCVESAFTDLLTRAMGG
jgi:Na+/proline symporter